MITVRAVSLDLYQRMVDLRRDLHQHPELSWQENRTAAKVCEFLDSLGVAYQSGVAGTGIVAELPGRRPGPVLALRADLDALPIHEETGLSFSSRVEGVMHACGHDGHTSMLLGAAALLAQESLPVPVRLIFQPAEEGGDGALAMVKAGALQDVAMIFGGHLDRHYDVGTIAVTEGPVNASSDRFTVQITGRGGHAARPHETVDAVVVGALLVIAIQTIVSREVNPAHPSVVTVGRFDAGTAANVIAGRATLEGTIRAQDLDVRQSLQRAVRRIAESVGQLHGAAMAVTIEEGTAPVINPEGPTALARQAAIEAVGQANVVRMAVANMGGEDFASYLNHVPGCYVRFGSRTPGTEGFPAHSSRFDFDEQALSVGATYYSAVAQVVGQHLADQHLADQHLADQQPLERTEPLTQDS